MKVGEDNAHPLGNGGKVSLFPKTEAEIIKILKYANSHQLSVSIVGGGTKRGFGGQHESLDLLLSFSEYKGIVEHAPGDMTITVKAGTTIKELQDYLAVHQQKVALDPFWPEYATIGGVIAANESGPKRLGYGSARDAIIGLRMIYADGTVIRAGGKVVKNVAGYDMNKLFVGSMGTLGAISEVTLKLRPLAKQERLLLISFPNGNIEDIRAFSVKVLDSTIEPVCLELLNPALSEQLLQKKYYTLMLSFEDVESSVLFQVKFFEKIQPANTELTILPEEDAAAFWEKFYSISPNGALEQTGEAIEAALKIGVVNLDILKVIKELELFQDGYNLSIIAHGGLGHGLCQAVLHGARTDAVTAIKDIREKVSVLGGYVIVKHLPYELRKTVNVWGEEPSYFFLINGIKAKADPNKILNPNRFVGGI
ncbi:FAD-binding oxidoreductase [Bacillaceae bacterium Marseille-Q3522]|nr:FAD-binding oxidoreductase [Bacillaceae bacterium Marseille-Q3522]